MTNQNVLIYGQAQNSESESTRPISSLVARVYVIEVYRWWNIKPLTVKINKRLKWDSAAIVGCNIIKNVYFEVYAITLTWNTRKIKLIDEIRIVKQFQNDKYLGSTNY